MANALDATYLGGGLSSSRLQTITVKQAFGKHVLAMFDYTLQAKAQYTVPAENTPVSARWGVAPLGVRTLYGYVNHYETVTPEVGAPFTRVFVLGTSKMMNSSYPSSWSETSRSSIAREIARRHKLRSIVHTHNVVVPTWVTGPRSDFQCLTALADEAGYRVFVDGSTLFFVDPTKVLSTASSNAAVRISNAQISKFKMVGGSNVPGANRASSRSLVYGVGLNGQVFAATGGDQGDPTRVVASSARTHQEAQHITSAGVRLESEHYVADMTVDGNANIYPGVMLQVEEGRITRDQGGYWLVTEANHTVTAGTFTTELVAVRGKDQRPVTQRTTVRGAAAFTSAVVRNGKTWESELQEHINV